MFCLIPVCLFSIDFTNFFWFLKNPPSPKQKNFLRHHLEYETNKSLGSLKLRQSLKLKINQTHPLSKSLEF